MTTPGGYSTGRVEWTVHGPDGKPVPGLKVTFKAPAWVLATVPGFSVAPLVITVECDAQGRIADAAGNPGVELPSTDSGLRPGWTWTATATHSALTPLTIVFELPAGSTVDLTNVAPVDASSGVPVTRGEPGDSAYQVAVSGGFVGTEAEWVASLHGADGAAPTLTAGVPTAVPAGGQPTVDLVETDPGSYRLDLGLVDGQAGATPTLETGAVSKIAPGGSPTLTLVEVNPGRYRLDSGLVTGDPGAPGSPTQWELRGTGSPVGVVPASPGTYYTDSAGTCGAWRWLKTSGTGNTGWRCVVGDTGWRDMWTDPSRTAVLAAGAMRLRRTESGIWVKVRRLQADPAQFDTPRCILFTLPQGFLPSGESAQSEGMYPMFTTRAINTTTSSVPLGMVYVYVNEVRLYGPPGIPHTGQVLIVPSSAAANAWPTVLPGVPAPDL